jgi:hypothetical protein
MAYSSEMKMEAKFWNLSTTIHSITYQQMAKFIVGPMRTQYLKKFISTNALQFLYP